MKNQKTIWGLGLTFLVLIALSACGRSAEEAQIEADLKSMGNAQPAFEEHLELDTAPSITITTTRKTSPSVESTPVPPLKPSVKPTPSPTGAPSTTPSATPSATKNPGEIRVKIFPHDGKYSTPHGREARFDRVVIKSATNCTMENQAGVVLSKAPSFALSTENTAHTVTIECAGPAEVRHVDMAGKSHSGNSYEGRLEVSVKNQKSGKKHLQIVNRIDHEDYLKGVVPSEMPGSWNLEALKVQAVAARTYSLNLIEKRRRKADPTEDFDLDDTVLYQAYKGLTGALESTDQAVKLTEGEVVTYQGKSIQAFFSADCGGFTQSAKNAWGNDLGYAQAVKEPMPLTSLPHEWVVSISTLTLRDFFRRANLLMGDPAGRLKVESVDSSGRATSIALTNAPGFTKAISASSFESTLHLRSRLFTVTSNRPTVLTGRGFGHGVGLSQWGAKVLTQAPFNWSYKKVINFYYTDTALVRL